MSNSRLRASQVPLNYSAPDAEQASIALIRKRALALGPLYRGPILINPGGPGGSGVEVVRLAGKTLSTILGPQFDIVGFDPRGTFFYPPSGMQPARSPC